MTNGNAAERIQKQKINLLLDEPFFGSLLMQLPLKEDLSVPTFCTNGVDIRYNSEYVDTLSDLQIRGVMIHEIEHIALLHPWRRGGRDLRKCNVAGDYAINNYLVQYLEECRNKRLPTPFALPDLLVDPNFKDLSMEEIYARIPDPPKSDETGGEGQGGEGQGEEEGQGEGKSSGEFTDAPGDEVDQKESEEKTKIAVQQAVQAAEMQGKLPASMKRLINEIFNPKLSWQEVLKDWMTERAKTDYVFSRPNTRYLASGFILPSLNDDIKMGTLVVGIDTSGSISQDDLNRFISELSGIIHDCQPVKTVVLTCDAQIQTEQEFYPGEELEAQIKGGGGTNFCPVFERVNEMPDEIAGLIYMTDLYGTFPQGEPSYPVLWAINSDNERVPWGQTVFIG